MFCKWSAREAGRCDLKTYYQLATHWQKLPPENILIWQIAKALNIYAPSGDRTMHTSAQTGAPVTPPNHDASTEAGISQLQQAGFPAFQGSLSPTVSAMLADLPLE